MDDGVAVRVGPPVKSTPSRQLIVAFYDEGPKGLILCQMGNSDTYVATPIAFKSLLAYYWKKIRG